MRAFLEHARVIEEDDFLIGCTRELRGNQHELSQDDYVRFLRSLNDQFKLLNPVVKRRRLRTAERICEAADALPIIRQHSVVLVAVGCVYGNLSARKVMKFKADGSKFNPVNALGDIMVISRLLPRKIKLEHRAREGKAPYARCDFLTDDTGLVGVLKCFEAEATRSERIGDVLHTFTTMSIKFSCFFPELAAAGGDALALQQNELAAVDEAAALRRLVEN